MKYPKSAIIFTCAVALSLTACGGALDATIGGTVTGLSGGTTVVLLDNGTDQLSVPSNGSFTFGQQIEAGSTYDVTIASQPAGETCSVSNGSGTVEQNSGDVSSIVVNCVATISANNDVLGTVTGLNSGNSVVLTNNGTDSVTITSTGTAQSFVFPTPLAVGAIYNVAVSTQPSGQTCSVTHATGTILATGTIQSVSVICN